MVPIIVVLKMKRSYGWGCSSRIRRNNRLAKKYLSRLKKQINNKELFYIALEKQYNFLKAKLNIETTKEQG
jgi:hypothetical protein